MKDDQPEARIEESADVLLTLDEAVKFLDTSKSTLYRLLSQQDLKGVKVGKQWRFRKADLVAYVERGPVAVAVDAFARADLDSELNFFDHEWSTGGGVHDGEASSFAIRKFFDRDWSTDVHGDNGTDVRSPESKIVDLANRIVQMGIARNASDIHLEPTASSLRVRFRIDGVLQDVRRVPPSLCEPLMTRFKEIVEMNLIEKRLPQDGRFAVRQDEREFDIRASLLPTIFGENMVMRVLDQSSTLIGLSRLGMRAQDLEAIVARLHQNSGLILVTGPTGSGKTTLLYSFLREIANQGKKVITAEDPVECTLPDITQVQLNSRVGLTYAAAMRSALRQDPDVIMCGEMRDLETAELVMNATLTGHIVLSALHTEDAAGALLRLAGMGIEPYVVSAAVKCVLATRLARRLCPNCKEVADFEDNRSQLMKARELSDKGGYQIPREAKLFSPVGCEQCHQTGFRGRIGLYEVLPCNAKLVADLIRCGSEEEASQLAVQSGMKTLLADGMRKAVSGETSIDEVLRATGAWA